MRRADRNKNSVCILSLYINICSTKRYDERTNKKNLMREMPLPTVTPTAIIVFTGILLWNIASYLLSSGFTTSTHDEDSDNDDLSNTMHDAVRVEYRHMAAWYDDFWRSYTNATLELPLIIATESLLQAQQRRTTSFVLVDVGCGTGSFLRCLVDRIKVKVGMTMDNIIHLIGAEPSKEMLEVARKKFVGRQKDESIFTTTTCKVSLENFAAERLLINDNIADVIVSTNAFHFFRNNRRSLLEMQRVLKLNGTIIIVDWCADYTLVRIYHLLFERMRWNWRFVDHPYPSPLSSVELVNLVKTIPGLQVIRHSCYQVRVFSIFLWGMQSIIIRRID